MIWVQIFLLGSLKITEIISFEFVYIPVDFVSDENYLILLYRDKEGDTPRDLMFDMVPEALLYILSRTAVSTHGNSSDKDVIIRLDFG